MGGDGRGAGGVIVWCGGYEFGRDNVFLPRAASFANRFVNKRGAERPPDSLFRDQLDRLRASAPVEARVVTEQLAHRWAHQDCPPCLYVLTCTLRAPEGGVLLDEGDQPVHELACTKVGQTTNDIATRLRRYQREVLGRLQIVEGSQTLRVLVYGHGLAVPLESEIKAVARRHGMRPQVVDDTGARHSMHSDETYVGTELVEILCAFARAGRPAIAGGKGPPV